MTNISGMVWAFIDKDTNLQASLGRDFVNVRALAKHIINEISTEHPSLRHKLSVNAVITSIRRYGKNTSFQESMKKARDAARGMAISTRNNIVVLMLKKDKGVQELFPELFKLVDPSKNELLRIMKADESIKIAVDEKNLDRFLQILPKKEIIKVTKNLAEINMRVSEISFNTPGVIATITSELFLHSINIVEMVTLIPEIIVIVDNSQLLGAYKAIDNLAR